MMMQISSAHRDHRTMSSSRLLSERELHPVSYHKIRRLNRKKSVFSTKRDAAEDKIPYHAKPREPRDFSPDGMLYLFHQEPYKTKIGA